MTRTVVVGFLFIGTLFCGHARICNPDEGVEPGPCDPSVCLLPECACEQSEPEVPLADRPQVGDLLSFHYSMKAVRIVVLNVSMKIEAVIYYNYR